MVIVLTRGNQEIEKRLHLMESIFLDKESNQNRDSVDPNFSAIAAKGTAQATCGTTVSSGPSSHGKSIATPRLTPGISTPLTDRLAAGTSEEARRGRRQRSMSSTERGLGVPQGRHATTTSGSNANLLDQILSGPEDSHSLDNNAAVWIRTMVSSHNIADNLL